MLHYKFPQSTMAETSFSHPKTEDPPAENSIETPFDLHGDTTFTMLTELVAGMTNLIKSNEELAQSVTNFGHDIKALDQKVSRMGTRFKSDIQWVQAEAEQDIKLAKEAVQDEVLRCRNAIHRDYCALRGKLEDIAYSIDRFL